MNWKLEWAWESDHFFESDTAYFETEEDAMDFVKKVKENPYREITSMYLTYVKRLVQICANCTNLFFGHNAY